MPADLDIPPPNDIEATGHCCCNGCIAEGKTKWTMRIPADENRDSDLLISRALAEVPAMADEIERLRRALAESAICRATLNGWACELPNGHNGPHFRVNPSSGSDSWWPVPPESLTAVVDERQPTEDPEVLAAAVANGEGWPVEVEEK